MVFHEVLILDSREPPGINGYRPVPHGSGVRS
jgi:hypothetical protein